MVENQIKEVIHSSKCSVFFIDESQRVTMSDIGSFDEIKKWAKAESSEVTQLKLLSQFRCNGSDGYMAWVDNTLEIQPTANYNLEDIDYDIRILDSPLEVRELIIEKNKINEVKIFLIYDLITFIKKKPDCLYELIILDKPFFIQLLPLLFLFCFFIFILYKNINNIK